MLSCWYSRSTSSVITMEFQCTSIEGVPYKILRDIYISAIPKQNNYNVFKNTIDDSIYYDGEYSEGKGGIELMEDIYGEIGPLFDAVKN